MGIIYLASLSPALCYPTFDLQIQIASWLQLWLLWVPDVADEQAGRIDFAYPDACLEWRSHHIIISRYTEGAYGAEMVY